LRYGSVSDGWMNLRSIGKRLSYNANLENVCCALVFYGQKKRAPRRVPQRLFVFHGGAGTRLHSVTVGGRGVVGRKPSQALAERVFYPLGWDSDPHDAGLLPLGEEHGLDHASPIGEDNVLDFVHFGPPSRLGVVIGTLVRTGIFFSPCTLVH
jgi:hypothetical protein